MKPLLCLFIVVSFASAAEEYTWWIDDCTAEAARATGCQPGDSELGRWALEAWQRESNGALVVKKSASEAHARIRIHWAGGAQNLYGETEPTLVDGRRGASIYVLPDVNTLGDGIAATARRDPLFRDAIVYLTCLHESGHALGLDHTRSFADIMYSFVYGGDILGYFERYRNLLKSRADIASHSGISDADRIAIRSALVRQ